jgi:hypothetical protein
MAGPHVQQCLRLTNMARRNNCLFWCLSMNFKGQEASDPLAELEERLAGNAKIESKVYMLKIQKAPTQNRFVAFLSRFVGSHWLDQSLRGKGN